MYITGTLNSTQLQRFLASVNRAMPQAILELRGHIVHVYDVSHNQSILLSDFENALKRAS